MSGVKAAAAAHPPVPVAIGAVLVAGVVAAFQIGKAGIATPLLIADLSIDLGSAGWLTGVVAVLGLVGSVPAGAAVAQWDDRKVMACGLALLVLGGVAAALAPDFGMLLAARALEGFGFVLVSVSGPSIVERLAPGERRNLVLALWSCFMPTGIALAMLSGALADDWRALWWTGAALTAFAALGIATVPGGQSTARFSRSHISGKMLDLLRKREPLLLAVIFAAYSFAFFALFSFLPLLLATDLGFTSASAALVSAAASAANIAGNMSAGLLATRGVRPTPILVTASMALGLCAAGVFTPILSDTARLLLCVLFSAIGGLIPATLIGGVPALAPAGASAVAFGLLMQGSNLGQIAGPVAIGRLVDAFGWSAAAIAVCAAMAISASCAVAIGSARKPAAR